MKIRRYSLRAWSCLLVICAISCNPFPSGSWQKGEQILYIHTMDPSLVILKQSYETGAWDTETPIRSIAWDLDANEAYTQPIDTFNRYEWCPIYVPIRDWDAHGYGLSPTEAESLKGGEAHVFLHQDLKNVDSLLLNKDVYPQVVFGKRLFGKQSISDDFHAYIFYSGGGLVLQTFTSDFEPIQTKELALTSLGDNYSYHKSSEFTSANTFEINKEYKSFEVTDNGSVIPGSTMEVRFTTQYEITDDGRIERTNKKLFGDIVSVGF